MESSYQYKSDIKSHMGFPKTIKFLTSGHRESSMVNDLKLRCGISRKLCKIESCFQKKTIIKSHMGF